MKQKILDFYRNKKKLTLIITFIIFMVAFSKPLSNFLIKELDLRGFNVSSDLYISSGDGSSTYGESSPEYNWNGYNVSCDDLYDSQNKIIEIGNFEKLEYVKNCIEFYSVEIKDNFEKNVYFYIENKYDVYIKLYQDNNNLCFTSVGEIDELKIPDSAIISTKEEKTNISEMGDSSLVSLTNKEPVLADWHRGICSLLSIANSLKFSMGYDQPTGWPDDTYYSKADQKTYWNPEYIKKLADNAGVTAVPLLGGISIDGISNIYKKYPGGQSDVKNYFFTNDRSFYKRFYNISEQVSSIQDIITLIENNSKVDCLLYTNRHVSHIKSIDNNNISITNTLDQGFFAEINSAIPVYPGTTIFDINNKSELIYAKTGSVYEIDECYGERFLVYWEGKAIDKKTGKIPFAINCTVFK